MHDICCSYSQYCNAYIKIFMEWLNIATMQTLQRNWSFLFFRKFINMRFLVNVDSVNSITGTL